MRLTNIAIRAIIEHSPGIKSKLALALDCSEGSINRYIRENDDNLTKAAALEVIRKETGLTEEEILEKEPTNDPGKTRNPSDTKLDSGPKKQGS